MVLYYKSVTKEPDIIDRDTSIQENIEKAEIIKAISNNHPGERNASVASVSPISHISVDSLMSNDDHYSYQVSTNKENFINRQIFDDIYKTPYIDKKSLECAYQTIIESNFNNLSLDDKLIVIHRSNMNRERIINNYIIICLSILIMIALKLFLFSN
jgi:hypothetical protein